MTNPKQNADGGFDENSLSLTGAVAMGTGVMVGAGIFALTGQIAEKRAVFPRWNAEET